MLMAKVNNLTKKCNFDNFENDLLGKIDKLKYKRENFKMSPKSQSETGAIDTQNYKINPTKDTFFDDKSNNFCLDFSPDIHKRNIFVKKYNYVLNELSPCFSFDPRQKLKLLTIQTKLDKSRNEKSAKKSFSGGFSSKLQDIKYDYLTQETNNSKSYISKSPLRTISNLEKRNEYNLIKNKNSFMSSKLKSKMVDFIETTNISKNINKFWEKNEKRDNTPNNYFSPKEKKLENFSFKKSDDFFNKNYFSQSQTDNLYKHINSEMTSPKRKKENQKQMIVDLINLDFKDKGKQKSESGFYDFGQKESVSKFHFYKTKMPSGYNYDLNRNSHTSNVYLSTEKYSSDLMSKMKKKFPDYIKNEKGTFTKKKYPEGDKLASIKSQLEKLFQ